MGHNLDALPRYTRALVKSHLLACGLGFDDVERPIIAVANSWNEFNHGHRAQRELAEEVKRGIRDAGATPLEFNTIGPCDAFAQGNAGMSYILPSREVVADSVELTVRGHSVFDGLVAISSCDKITPGMLMAMFRLDLPAIHISAGPCRPAISFAESKKIRNSFIRREIDERTMAEGSAQLYGGGGICSYIGTANTMNCMAEALGMSLPGAATAPVGTAKRKELAYQTGLAAVAAYRAGRKPSSFVTADSFENAIRVAAAISGSLNLLLHMPAAAAELGIPLDFAKIDAYNDSTPLLCTINPNGPHSMADLDDAGGIPAVMKELAGLLRLDAGTVEGKSVRDVAGAAQVRDADVIRSVGQPVEAKGGLVVLTGNIAPDGAAMRRSLMRGTGRFSGKARVFDSEEEASGALEAGKVADGSVVLIRYEGPKGGPGMREMHRITDVVRSIGDRVAVVTDGRFSGASGGIAVGYVSPEAAAGGPIGAVRDGDEILIDVEAKRLDALVPAEEWERRLREFRPRPRREGVARTLRDYAARVGPTNLGARLAGSD